MPPATPPHPRRLAPVLALDIGNVCYHLTFDAACRRFGYDSFAHLHAHQPDLIPWSKQVETGRISEADFLHGLARRLPARLADTELTHAWNSIIGPEIDGVAAVIDEAHAAGLRVVFMSDIGPTHHRYVRDTLSFIHRIHAGVLSYEVGALKPDSPMYDAMERLHCDGGVPCLYTDDKAENIAAGAARHWPTYTFGDPAGLRAALHQSLARLAAQD